MKSIGSKPTGAKLRLMVEERMHAMTKTAGELSNELGYRNGHMLAAFLKGFTKLPLDRLRPLSDAIKVEFAVVLELWLNDCMPTLLQQPEFMVVTADERRLLEKIREHYAGNAASLIVADGRDLVAVVMA